MKGETFRYRFGNETKTFWYSSRSCLVENRLFRSGLESALLDQLEMCSFDEADSGTNSDGLASFMLDVRMFVECGLFAERLLLYCFDITQPSVSSFSKLNFCHYQVYSSTHPGTVLCNQADSSLILFHHPHVHCTYSSFLTSF
jgi:hypothetical protein